MSFLNPAALWHLAWLVPLLFFLYFNVKMRRMRVLSAVLGTRACDESFSTLSKRARFIRFIILGLAMMLIVLSIARPYWGMRMMPFTSKGRDILFALDVSKSMLSKDVQPSRIDHAKWFARQIVKSSPGDRFGLIAFAGTASLDCPLTTDITSFNQVLNEIEPGSAAMGGTNIQAALETALKAFNAAEGGHRAVVLISDGGELTGNSASVIDFLKTRKIPLFIAGVGDPSKPGLIPVKGEDGKTSFMRDSSGELVKSALNEKQLSALALGTGGVYVRSTVTAPGTDIVINRIRALVPKDLDGGIHSKPIERFHIPLVAAIVLILIWFMIPEKKKTQRSPKGIPAAAALLLLIPFLIPFSSSAENATEKKELPLSIAPDAEKLAAKDKDETKDKEVLKGVDEIFNKARELHEKSPEAAVKLYQQAINEAATRQDIRAKACQNLGVIQHYKSRNVLAQSLEMVKKQDLDGALKNIDSALKELDKSEEFYRQAMSSEKLAIKKDEGKKAVESSASGLLSNQQKLLNDRANAENLKKKIEELKKQQKEAQKKTQQAKDEQKKANQDKQQNKDNKQKEQKQDKADQARNEAQKAVDEMKKKADDMGQKNMSDSAKEAQEELKKAKEKAAENKGKEAEKHIDKALEKLGQPQQDKQDQQKDNKDNNDNKDNKKNKDQKGDKDKQKDGDKNPQDKQEDNKDKNGEKDQKGQRPDKKLSEKKDNAAKAAAKDKEKAIDPEQAEALLELMAGQEKNLRDAIKEYQKKHYQQEGPEKDW